MTALERAFRCALLTVLLALAAPVAAQAAGREFKVLVFTRAVGEQHASTAAGVKAIKDLGKERRFIVNATDGPDGVPRRPARAVPRGRVPQHVRRRPRRTPQQAAFENYYQRRRRLPRHPLGDRDRARLDVPDRPPRHARRRARRPSRRRRSRSPTACTTPARALPEYWQRTDALVQLRGQRPRPLARARHGRRDHLRRRHDGLRPPGRLVQGLPGRPLVLHGRRRHRRARSRSRDFRRPPRPARIEWAAGEADPVYSDCGATVLANYQQTKISRAAEPQRADRLRPAARRPHPADRPRRPACACTTRRRAARRSSPTLPVYTNSEDGLYGPAVDNDFATNNWVYLYYAPLTMDGVRTRRQHDPATTPPAPRRRRRPTRARGTPGRATSSSRASSSSTATNPTLDLASEQKIMKVDVNRGACCHVAGDIDFDRTTTCGWSRATTRPPAAATPAASRRSTT